MKNETLQYLKAITTAFGPDESVEFEKDTWKTIRASINALLEQEQGEPVAVVGFSGLVNVKGEIVTFPLGTQFYTTPQQRTWVGLTDEEVVQCQQGNIWHFYRAIEAKLKEKNNA
jgi:hypothetical protein